MGMTIDETIDFFKGLKCGTLQAEDARDVAISTMQKYKQIEQILHNGFGKGVYAVFDEIIEVMQDGIPTGSTINPFFTVSGVNELAKYSIETIGHSDPYLQGMCNGIEYMRARLTDTEPHFITEVESEG